MVQLVACSHSEKNIGSNPVLTTKINKMEKVNYYKGKKGLHYYKVTDSSDKVLHIMANLSNDDIKITDHFKSGYRICTIEKDSFLINNLEKTHFMNSTLNETERCSKEEFTEVLSVSIFELGIYESTLSKV